MQTLQRSLVIVSILALLAQVVTSKIEAQEGRPMFGRERASEEARRRSEEDKARRSEERRVDDKKSDEKKPVTRAEEGFGNIDPTKRYNTDPRSLEALEAKIRADELRKAAEEKKENEARDVKFTKPGIEEQLAQRGWTKDEVTKLSRGKSSGTSIDGRDGKNEPASVYGERGKYVVVNDVTREVLQVSDKNNLVWRDDSRINWR